MVYFGSHNNFGILNTKKKGIWTVNLHINTWNDIDFCKILLKKLEKFETYVVDYEYINNNYYKNKLNFLDFLKIN